LFVKINLHLAKVKRAILEIRGIELNNIDEKMIIDFLRFLVIESKVSTSYQNHAIYAIKFYYERVKGGLRKVYLIERPMKEKEKALPVVLNVKEIGALLKATENIKHKAILMLGYSSGLRLGELVNVRLQDIDSKRMQLRVEQSKGKKDRYSILSNRLLDILREYFKIYKPKEWLFEGAGGGPYSPRSIQFIMKDVVKKAGIKKKVSVHSLRHSFGTAKRTNFEIKAKTFAIGEVIKEERRLASMIQEQLAEKTGT